MRAPPLALAAALLSLAATPLVLGDASEGPALLAADGLVRVDAPWPSVGAFALRPTEQAARLGFVERDAVAVSQEVVLAGDGSAGFASWWLNNERISKYDPGQGAQWSLGVVPYGIQHGLGVNGDGNVATAVLDGPAALPVGAPGIGLGSWLLGAGPTTSFRASQGPCCSGFTAVSDAGLVAVANHAARTGPGDQGTVALYALGTPLPIWSAPFSDDLNGAAGGPRVLQGVDISADGTTIAVTTYYTVFVFQLPLVEPVAVLPNRSQTVAKLSSDGSFLALGGFSSTAALYGREANGNYGLRWFRNVGHPWVTSVAVADDGTLLAGTFNFNGPSKAVALRGFNGFPLWECVCYGDYVDEVVVTPDGRRAAAVSWGAFGGAGGDVLTVFDAADGSVVHRLASGIDETGSLFDVAISDDGRTVLAGGKAVHARQLGNGGMVYGFLLD